MPDRNIHLKIDRALFGREYPEVHDYLDEPFMWWGLFHRIERHTPLDAVTVAKREESHEAGVAAMAHHIADFVTVFPIPIMPLYRRVIRKLRGDKE